MNYVIIIIVFAVLGFIFGTLIYFTDYKIGTHKKKSEEKY